jgi:hypothetical protein
MAERLEQRELRLNGVFAPVPKIIFLDGPRVLQDGPGQLCIDGHLTQRRLPCPVGHNRHPCSYAGMVRPQDHKDIGKGKPGVHCAGDPPGVDVTGMGDNRPDRAHRLEIPGDQLGGLRPQALRRTRVERTGHGCPSNHCQFPTTFVPVGSQPLHGLCYRDVRYWLSVRLLSRSGATIESPTFVRLGQLIVPHRFGPDAGGHYATEITEV